MKVLLVHNPDAGETDHQSADLARLIEQAGHNVRSISRKAEDLDRHLEQAFDLIAAAGGDGTVTQVAQALIGKSTPFTILPLGTANNLAHSIGITSEPVDLIPGWRHGTVRPFDCARATHPHGTETFFESAGLGLFTEMMCLALSHKDTQEKFTGDERFDRDFRLLRRLAGSLPSLRCTIEVDDRSSEESVILCEIMNARQAGSRLVLAPEADVGDGLLDLVVVTEQERSQLQDFLRRDPSDDHRPHLPVRRGRRFRITSRARRIHLADTIERFMTGTTPWTLEVEVQPGAVQVLVPAM